MRFLPPYLQKSVPIQPKTSQHLDRSLARSDLSRVQHDRTEAQAQLKETTDRYNKLATTSVPSIELLDTILEKTPPRGSSSLAQVAGGRGVVGFTEFCRNFEKRRK